MSRAFCNLTNLGSVYLKKKLTLLATLLLILVFALTSCSGGSSDDETQNGAPPLNIHNGGTNNENATDTSSTDSNHGGISNGSAIVQDPVQTPEPTRQPFASPTPYPGPMALFTGQIYHVFYHSLASFPEIAFSNSFGANLDHDTITPREFWRSLEELYRNNYVLINIDQAVGVDADGIAYRRRLYLPIGKKPLVMSFDDINFYTRNIGRGIADRVILTADGELAMETRMPDGSINISFDNCVIPLLEEFIAQHPNFSPFGVRGMLALTGFDGVLGYRTHIRYANRDAEIAAVAPIVEELLARGWYFASHGYGHIHKNRVSLERFREDTDQWIRYVAPILGETNMFVFPYGEHTFHWRDGVGNCPKFLYLIERGYRIFCGVGIPTFNRFSDGIFFMDRANIDGFSLRNHGERLAHLMDVNNVYYPPERLWGQLPVTW